MKDVLSVFYMLLPNYCLMTARSAVYPNFLNVQINRKVSRNGFSKIKIKNNFLNLTPVVRFNFYNVNVATKDWDANQNQKQKYIKETCQ